MLTRENKYGVKELNYDYISSKGEIFNKSIKNEYTIKRTLKLFEELGIKVSENR